MEVTEDRSKIASMEKIQTFYSQIGNSDETKEGAPADGRKEEKLSSSVRRARMHIKLKRTTDYDDFLEEMRLNEEKAAAENPGSNEENQTEAVAT